MSEAVERLIEEQTEPTPLWRRVVKILVRVAVVVGALALAMWILATSFDDLDPQAIWDAVTALEDADAIALVSMWILWIAAQGLLTASLIAKMPVRHGVIAYLGPAGVTSLVPGPSDLPFRYRMLTSWGHSPADATLAVAAGGIFSIGIKLVLPVVAALGLVVSDAPVSGTLQTVVVISLILGVAIVIFAFVFGSEKRTQQAGRLIAPIWALVLRMLRKPQPADLAERMVEARGKALHTLRERWLIASWATVLTAATKFALLLMCLRFAGLPEDDLPWPQVFIVFALVQGLTVIPITPGDAGVSEIAYVGMLTAAAGSEYVNQISAGVLIFRVLTWVVIIPIGLAVLGGWNFQWRRRNRQAANVTLDG